jgi:hypothetical protein
LKTASIRSVISMPGAHKTMPMSSPRKLAVTTSPFDHMSATPEVDQFVTNPCQLAFELSRYVLCEVSGDAANNVAVRHCEYDGYGRAIDKAV